MMTQTKSKGELKERHREELEGLYSRQRIEILVSDIKIRHDNEIVSLHKRQLKECEELINRRKNLNVIEPKEE